MKRSFIFVLTLVTLTQALGAASYYVAPSGNDSAVGSLAAPWKTLAKAAAMAQPGDTVYLRQGAYRETLTPQRSGSSAAPIVFRGYPGESAVLAGSELVTGSWSVHSGKIWRIDGLPATWSVYVDGVELEEARWPNAPVGAAMDANWAVADTGTDATTLVDSALPATDLSGAKVRIVAGSAWVTYSRTVQGYGGGRFSFDSSVGPNVAYYPKAGNEYVLYRHLALLDSAGEWYQDPTTGRLYLWMPAGDSPALHQVEIAQRRQVATINAFSYIQLRDLVAFSGGLSFINSSGSKVIGVQQRYVHTNRDVDGYNYGGTLNQFSGGSGGEWANGSIMGSWGDGLYISGTGHSVHDMTIHDVCRVGTYRGAIRMGGSGHSITRNTLYDSGRFLIFHDQAKGGSLSYNHLYHAGLLTNDLGATYCFRANGNKMEIHHNIVHSSTYTVGAGIYLDNASSNFIIHHNLVYDVVANALILNLPSYDNLVVNNTLYAGKNWVNAAGSQYAQEMTGTALVNNLYSGGTRLIGGALGPSLITNGTYTAPPAIFNTGAWTLAPGSPAIDKGSVEAPYTDGYCGAKPDQGAFEYGCGTAWSAGSTSAVPAFPYPLPSSSAPTATLTTTPTRTRTSSPSRSATASATPSATRTSTASATPSTSRTSTGTRTPSPTLTATASPTPSPTLSSTASATATASPTKSATASSTPSRSATKTESVTASRTPSSTASPTLTVTGSLTPNQTLTVTASLTPSQTLTVTASLTISATPTSPSSPTPSPTTTATGSLTPASTLTATLSPAFSLTASVTPSGTRTASASPTASVSATPTPSGTAPASPTTSPTASGTPSAPTPAPSSAVEGPLVLERVVAAPNPVSDGRLRLSLKAQGPADQALLRLYSPALVCVREAQLPGGGAGWSQAGLGLEGLSEGLYYCQVRLKRGALLSAPVLVTIYLQGKP